MHYILTNHALGKYPSIDLSKDEFVSASIAKQNLLHALAIEEKFHFVLENYKEFVEGVLQSALRESLFSEHGWSDGITHLNAANRRLQNLLSIARSYFDQTSRDLKRIYGRKSKQSAAFELARKRERDRSLAYRTMEALRNYGQHCALPIHGGGSSFTRHQSDNESAVVATMELTLNVIELKSDGAFESKVLLELVALGKTVNIKPFIRDYVCCLGRIHQQVRNDMTADLSLWAKAIRDLRQRFATETGSKDLIGLHMIAEDDQGKLVLEVDMFDKFIERREMLEKRCINPETATGCVVASELVPK